MLGLFEARAPRAPLLRAAQGWLQKGKRPRRLLASPPVNAVLDTLIRPWVKKKTLQRTHGHYPAVEKAMEIILRGAGSWDTVASMARERDAICELIATDSTRQLMNLFFLRERAKKLRVPDAGEGQKVRQAAVIGAGVMGSGIAQWLSARGLPVILRDIDATRVGAGMGNVAKLYAEGVKRRVFTEAEARAGRDRVVPAHTEVPLQHVDLVIEAAVEKMEIKKTIFRRLDEQIRPDCILATNTSALSIAELASATRDPSRVIGIHFFNPVHRMQLVEVVTGPQTAPDVTQTAVRFIQGIGKLPVVVKDSPGFVVNRILLPYMLEAGRLFDEGAALHEIDAAMTDFGMPMGPLRLTDEVGVDIAADVAATLSAAFPDRLEVPPILSRMAGERLLGRKAGQGFYAHMKGKDPQPAERATTLRRTHTARGLSRTELERRMVLLMVNEAARCLEERIVAEPADIDFAMVMGTGWAPFRGGPLRYADSIGASRVCSELEALATSGGSRFAPCSLLTQMASQSEKFYAY
jgi:3-hydroxyacyl-CoA dehydrogenase / enoyl-CoA hydratase / 3-hydroxybutyryl-CoA epimerase